jgi:putative peptide zinc metalloprotease protein
MQNSDIKWEELREDLILIPGASNRSGAPSWTLQDPAAGQFYRLGWLEFEILKRWHIKNAQHILDDVHRSTLLRPGPEDILRLYQFLKSSCLLQATSQKDTQNLLLINAAPKRGGFLQKMMKNYLFFRIPLVRPERFLDAIKPLSTFLLRDIFLKILLCCAILGGILVMRDWETFLSGFKTLQSPSGLLYGFIILAASKIIHELGHAMACKHYGCRVPTMGVAFIVLWPLLWTDTTDAWRLSDKRERLRIDGAGMLAELTLAALASILWAVAPEGAFKGAMHMLAGITWVMTLFINLNPFMRFDGYYLLSDALDIPNIQDRSFKLAKNWIRKTLWHLKEPKPEQFPPRMELGLILYAFGTWVYRFFLFLGIALLVYHFFFKALGVFLMVVELWWFIARPVTNECLHWIKNKGQMTLPLLQKIALLSFVCLVGAALFVPWHGEISAPSIVKNKQEIPLFTSSSAVLKHINVTSGQRIKKDDVLFVFENPDLSYEILLAEQQVSALEKDINNKSVDQKYYREATLLEKELKEQRSTLSLKQIRAAELIITAPIDGIISDIPDSLASSEWVGKKEYLGLVRSAHVQIEAFIKETDLSRIQENSRAVFYARNLPQKAVLATLVAINKQPSKYIPYPELGSDFGGDITIDMKRSQASYASPKERHYKVIIKPREALAIELTSTGTSKIQSQKQSLFTKTWRKLVSIIIQESGF